MNTITLKETTYIIETMNAKMKLINSLAFVLYLAASTEVYTSDFVGALDILTHITDDLYNEMEELQNNLFAAIG